MTTRTLETKSDILKTGPVWSDPFGIHVGREIEALSRINLLQEESLESKARINVLWTKTLNSRSYILVKQSKSLQSKGNIRSPNEKVVSFSSKASIIKNTRTLKTKANIFGIPIRQINYIRSDIKVNDITNTLTSKAFLQERRSFWYWSDVIETVTPIQSLQFTVQQEVPTFSRVTWYATNNYGDLNSELPTTIFGYNADQPYYFHNILLGVNVIRGGAPISLSNQRIAKYTWDDESKSIIRVNYNTDISTSLLVFEVCDTDYGGGIIYVEDRDYSVNYNTGEVSILDSIDATIVNGTQLYVRYKVDGTKWEDLTLIVNESGYYYSFGQETDFFDTDINRKKFILNQFRLKAFVTSAGKRIKIYKYYVVFDYFKDLNPSSYEPLLYKFRSLLCKSNIKAENTFTSKAFMGLLIPGKPGELKVRWLKTFSSKSTITGHWKYLTSKSKIIVPFGGATHFWRTKYISSKSRIV